VVSGMRSVGERRRRVSWEFGDGGRGVCSASGTRPGAFLLGTVEEYF
jgi:hypothetical protein